MLGAGLILLLAGCAQTATGPTTTLAPLGGTVPASSTIVLSVATTGTEGYVAVVLDGHTFDLQDGQRIQRVVLQHIAVPNINTCEGQGARALLASLVAGKLVRVDAEGAVWVGDIDVAGTMVAYGYATAAANTRYVTADMNSVDYNCANTTTIGVTPTIVLVPQAPRPTRGTTIVEDTEPGETDPSETDPSETAPRETDPPETEPEPEETAPPPARPDPPATPATPETRPRETEPEPQVTEPDRTPRVPKTPKLPDPPASG